MTGASAGRTIDATGKVVCPGFIDVHVYSELELLGGGTDRYTPLQMGVTTQLASPDGFSWAPLPKQLTAEMKDYLHVFYTGADDFIDASKDLSVEDLLSQFRGNMPSNLVLQVPHGSIRLAAMGWANRTASEDELRDMGKMTREWLEAGAKAFCTGLEYEPMRHSDLRELVYLSRIAAEYETIYVAHQRGYGDNVGRGCAETFAIAREAGIPVHISHLSVNDEAASLLERGINGEVDVSFDMYPYEAGCTQLLFAMPAWFQQGPPDAIRERLHDRSLRDQLAESIEGALSVDRMRFASVGTPSPSGWEGKSLGEVQRELGLSLTDTVFEALIRTDLQVLMVYHWMEERYHFLEQSFKHPLHMVSTDGIYVGRQPHPRGFGTYPKVIRELVYDKQWLSLEDAIYKMSGFPAKRFNIVRRGVLLPRHYADIVIFDPQRIQGLATFDNPRQKPLGIDYVFVNGYAVIADDQIHSGMSGRIL